LTVLHVPYSLNGSRKRACQGWGFGGVATTAQQDSQNPMLALARAIFSTKVLILFLI